MPGLPGILVVAVPLYDILLMTMVWRATARVQFFEVSITVHLEAVKCDIGWITAGKFGASFYIWTSSGAHSDSYRNHSRN
jgi:hypothetical protein